MHRRSERREGKVLVRLKIKDEKEFVMQNERGEKKNLRSQIDGLYRVSDGLGCAFHVCAGCILDSSFCYSVCVLSYVLPLSYRVLVLVRLSCS